MTGRHTPRAGLLYRENRCGVSWPLLLISVIAAVAGTLGVLLLVIMTVSLPPMLSFVLLALPLLFWVYRRLRVATMGWRLGIRIYDHQIQIGGLQRAERHRHAGWRRLTGRRAAGAINVLAQRRAVFTCPWQFGVEDLYLITGRHEIKEFIRRYCTEIRSVPGAVPLGFLTAARMRAALAIVHHPSLGASDPSVIRPVATTRGVLRPVPSRVWLIPTRHPGSLRAALAQTPAAPPLQDGPPPAYQPKAATFRWPTTGSPGS